MNNIKTLIFDFDGTLCDTCDMIVATMQRIVTQHGLPTPTYEECKATIGLPGDDCFAILTGLSPEECHQCTLSYDTNEMIPEHIKLVKFFPGVNECLALLKSEGYQMGIATSRKYFSVCKMLEICGMTEFFPMIFSPEQVKNGKPSPESALKIMELTGATPDETLVIGDSPYDIKMGRNAGCHTCAVTYGNGTREALEAAQAEFFIDHIHQLIDWLHSQQS